MFRARVRSLGLSEDVKERKIGHWPLKERKAIGHYSARKEEDSTHPQYRQVNVLTYG
jgi:hypothetical protein